MDMSELERLSNPVADVLRRAREIYAADVVVGQHCAQTAIHSACDHNLGTLHSDACAALLRATDIQGKPAWFLIWKWHDAPGRTKEEVLAAFDRAIALARSVEMTAA